MPEITDWEWCPECRAYHHEGGHLPLWLVWSEDYGESIDDAVKVRASDSRIAVERWAELSDSADGDYPIVSGSDVTACVVMAELKRVRTPDRYHVSGESVPKYDAVRVEP